MARPSKPTSVIKMEKRSHRTKAELAIRAHAESGLLSGRKIKKRPEINSDPEAKKEFNRVTKLLDSIEKNDGLYEAIINRYCIVYAEEKTLTKTRDEIFEMIKQLKEDMETLLADVDAGEAIEIRRNYTKDLNVMLSKAVELDRQLEKKRKQLMDIEKENVMTIASSLRSIPKKQETKTNELARILGGA